MDRILSGIKPTGSLTLGNYIGALKHFKDFQDQGEVFIFIADLHALTLPIDPEVLRENSRDIACFYLAMILVLLRYDLVKKRNSPNQGRNHRTIILPFSWHEE